MSSTQDHRPTYRFSGRKRRAAELGVIILDEMKYGKESLEALLKAHELDQKAGEPLYLSLTELAKLNLDQNKYEAVIGYFERAFIELDKVNASNEALHAYANLVMNMQPLLRIVSTVKS